MLLAKTFSVEIIPFGKNFTFKIMLFKKQFSLKNVLSKKAPKTQKLRFLRAKLKWNVIFCLQIFFRKRATKSDAL